MKLEGLAMQYASLLSPDNMGFSGTLYIKNTWIVLLSS